MAREEGTEAAALPKLLLDIVEQVEGRGGAKSGDGESDKKDEERQEENIAHNLPKVCMGHIVVRNFCKTFSIHRKLRIKKYIYIAGLAGFVGITKLPWCGIIGRNSRIFVDGSKQLLQVGGHPIRPEARDIRQQDLHSS